MQILRVSAMALVALSAATASARTPDEKHLILVARTAVEHAVSGIKYQAKPSDFPAKGVFVTIEVDGKVRGCRGSLLPNSNSLDEEVAADAEAAAAHDPRYRPLKREELQHFLVTVTIVDHLQPLAEVDDLTPDQGLVLTSGDRTGVVLPWEGKDPKTRLKWAYQKAGVSATAPARLQKLFAERFRG